MLDWNDPDLDKRPELMYRPKIDTRPISQLIACSQNFVKVPQGSWFDIGSYRANVIRATKIFVPHELMDERRNSLETLRKFYHEDLSGRKFIDSQNKKFQQYRQYARSPFPIVFLENDTGSTLVEEIEEKKWRITRSTNDGIIFPYILEFELFDTGNLENDFILHFDKHCSQVDDVPDFVIEEAKMVGRCTCMEVLEIFMFMNVSNITMHLIKPTNKEIANIPKVLRPKFLYRCLDIFREKKSFVSLSEVFVFLQDSHHQSEERHAHMVRGHFKAKKNGLFWWNSFMRCRKNISTAGYVDKDYRLVSK